MRDPATGEMYWPVSGHIKNLDNPDIFKVGKQSYGTKLPRFEDNNKWTIDYLPATQRKYADDGSTTFFDPAQFACGGKVKGRSMRKGNLGLESLIRLGSKFSLRFDKLTKP